MKDTCYVDLLIAEWGVTDYSEKLRRCVRRVLAELCAGSQLVLRRNPKLQVVILPEATFSVWAYFPVHRNRHVVRGYQIKLIGTARVLLVISLKDVEQQPLKKTAVELRHHLGHALLYLRSPRARNECSDAEKEWRQSV